MKLNNEMNPQGVLNAPKLRQPSWGTVVGD